MPEKIAWFKVDAHFADHPKTEDALDRHPLAISLWVLAGARCGKGLTDGHVSPQMLTSLRKRSGMKVEDIEGAAAALVAAGLWHSSRTIDRCNECSHVKVPRGSYLFHSWWSCNPSRDETLIPVGRVRWRRKEELRRNRKLCEDVDTLDRGLCRYCGVRVNWRDRRGATGGTRDHIDPDGDNSIENVVVACRECNGRKRDRTPAQWVDEDGLWSEDNPTGGRPLLPRPSPYATQAEPEPRLDPSQVEPGRDLASRARHTRDGADRVGPGSPPGSDPGRAQIDGEASA